MFCQECGAQIRAHAKFCNQCGKEVRQRFGEIDRQPTVALPLLPPPPKLGNTTPPAPPPTNQPLSKHSWPGAEDAIVMPALEKQSSERKTSAGTSPFPNDTGEQNQVRFDMMKPDTSDVQHAPNTGEINSSTPTYRPSEAALSAPPSVRYDAELKPFFTQVVTAIPNQHHNRLILVVPLLLLVAILLLIFAYIAAR
jgi:hypothetical protein